MAISHQQMKEFGVNELLNLFDVESGTGDTNILVTRMAKVYLQKRSMNKNIYIPKWYMILPTGTIIKHFKNGRKEREEKSSFLISLYLAKANHESVKKIVHSRSKNIKKYEIEVMRTDNVADDYWSQAFLTWTSTSRGKIRFGDEKLLIK